MRCSAIAVAKKASFIVGNIAVRPEHQHTILATEAMDRLIELIEMHPKISTLRTPPTMGGEVARTAADAIIKITYGNEYGQNVARGKNGIPLLVPFLRSERTNRGSLRIKCTHDEK